MKRVASAIFLICLSAVVVAQTRGDVRVRGIAGAYTGLADDANALFLNPAGLGYMDQTTLTFGLGVDVELNKRVMTSGSSDFPYVYESADYPGEYEYWDEFQGKNVRFDPADYGIDYDDGDPGAYEEAVQEYIEWQGAYGFYEFAQSTSNFFIIPRVTWATKNFGFSTISDLSIDFLTELDYDGTETPLEIVFTRRQGFMGALGFAFGPVSVGANLKVYNRAEYSIAFDAADFSYGLPDSFVENMFLGEEDLAASQGEPTIELGVGGLFTLGTISAGIYLDNLLFFINPDDSVNFGSLFDTLSFGVSYTPSNSKLNDDSGLLIFNASADFKNIGSEKDRYLAIGLETGLDILNVISVKLRSGYSQPTPGPLTAAFSNIDPRVGNFSVGMGMKFFIMEINTAFMVPGDVIFDPYIGTPSDEELNSLFGTAQVEVLFTF